MEANFSIKFSETYAVSDDLKKLSEDMQSLSDKIERVERDIRAHMNFDKSVLTTLRGKVDAEGRSICKMSDVLREVLEKYRSTEGKLQNTMEKNASDASAQGERGEEKEARKYNRNKSWFSEVLAFLGYGDSFTEEQIDSIVYDDDGTYGGDQGSPMGEWGIGSEKKALYKIVRNYYPDMTDEEIKDFLKKLNSEGCGYVAIVNTIFAEYVGREEEFEKDFGFPMYYKGDLNYDKLLVDFYTATDNHNLDSSGNDVVNSNEDVSAIKGVGTTAYDREYRINKYLKDKKVGMEMEQTIYGQNDITVDNFMDYAKKGQIVIGYHNGNLQNEDGSVAQYINGGHAMTVTGVTSDGRFIVSSWGEKYYIDPNEIISQTDANNKVKTTKFSFQLIDYKESGE